MSEASVVGNTAPSTSIVNMQLTPRSTPSPTNLDTAESKLSRKRDREVSLDPPTPKDVDPFNRERKYSEFPLKKNRRILDPTEEDEEEALPTGGSGAQSVSGSPPETQHDDSVLASPRREMKRKVRQISQGVEEISWKGPAEPLITEKDVEIADSADVIVPTISQVVSNGKANGQEVFDMVEEEETPPKTPEDSVLSRSVPDLKAIVPDTLPPEKMKVETADDAGRLHAFSESNEKGLKRKFLERGTSVGPPGENEQAAKQPGEALKRPRDDPDKDDNPRETKRPSPPPSPPKSSTSTKAYKPTGFMAYASAGSPFASIKGKNVFASKSSSVSAAGPATFQPAGLAPAFGSSASTPTPAKLSGFEAFASTSSPFSSFGQAKSTFFQNSTTSALGRAKSPPRSLATSAFAANPFASYAGSSNVFGLPAQKRQRGGSPNGSAFDTPTTAVFGEAEHDSEGDEEDQPQTFGEKLRAARDDDDNQEEEKPRLTEKDVLTGEEDEETIHQVRGKLFSLQGSSWKERGAGVLKLNVKQVDGTGARLVMRKDAVYTLLLNITLFPGMRCTLAQDPRYLRFTAIENGIVTTYNLKMADAKVAQDLLEEINANIPS